MELCNGEPTLVTCFILFAWLHGESISCSGWQSRCSVTLIYNTNENGFGFRTGVQIRIFTVLLEPNRSPTAVNRVLEKSGDASTGGRAPRLVPVLAIAMLAFLRLIVRTRCRAAIKGCTSLPLRPGVDPIASPLKCPHLAQRAVVF